MSGNISIVHEEPEPDDDEQLYADLSLAQLALSNTLPPPLLSPQLSFRPAMSSPTTNTFRDITAEFLRASEQLSVGQLVQDPDFTLFQAVGALEIMDPKMDSGLLDPDYERFDPWAPRLPEEIIGIMDRLLCDEMAWHLGSALSQTLFANLYIDKLMATNPARVVDATFGGAPSGESAELLEIVLRPYCIAVVKGAWYANYQITSEHIIEEEDFVSQTYGVMMLMHAPKEEVVGLLDAALEWLVERENEFKDGVYVALRNRLLLRRGLLDDLAADAGSYHGGSEGGWDKTLELLGELEKDHVLGKPVPEAWSMSVQRKLASSVPPRPPVEITFAEAATTLRQMCLQTKDLLKILEYKGATEVLTYFVHFGAQTPVPLPYTRSLIQSLLIRYSEILGGLQVKDILLDDLSELCHPPSTLLDPVNHTAEAPQSPRYQIAKRMDWFVDRAGRAYLELYRTLIHNRSRLRRVLCKAVLDWDSLQVEAEEVDSELREFTGEKVLQTEAGMAYSFPLSSWVYFHKLRIMEWIVLLGFELEVFPPGELGGMYWYLQYYLHTRISHVARIRTFVARSPQPDGEAGTLYARTLALLNFYLLEAAAMQDLAMAMVYLYAVLGRWNLLGPGVRPGVGSEILRYEGRMKPVRSIGCPEVVEYEYFRTVVDNPDVPTEELLALANEHVLEARKQYGQLRRVQADTARTGICETEWRRQMQGLLRSCFGVGVAIGVLGRELEGGGSGGEGVVVDLERQAGYHDAFMVPGVKVRS